MADGKTNVPSAADLAAMTAPNKINQVDAPAPDAKPAPESLRDGVISQKDERAPAAPTEYDRKALLDNQLDVGVDPKVYEQAGEMLRNLKISMPGGELPQPNSKTLVAGVQSAGPVVGGGGKGYG